MRMPNAPTRNGMRDSSARCWIVASSWLHHSLKQRLSLQHILSRTSTARLRRRTNRCRRWRLNPLRRHKGEWRRMHEAVELHEGHLSTCRGMRASQQGDFLRQTFQPPNQLLAAYVLAAALLANEGQRSTALKDALFDVGNLAEA